MHYVSVQSKTKVQSDASLVVTAHTLRLLWWNTSRRIDDVDMSTSGLIAYPNCPLVLSRVIFILVRYVVERAL